jgi:hypothetical protein
MAKQDAQVAEERRQRREARNVPLPESLKSKLEKKLGGKAKL